MSHDFIEPLSRFTPDASALDRDALLFEAGRASAPSPVRAWLLVGLLALSQALTVGFLLMPSRPVSPLPAPLAPGSGYPVVADSLTSSEWPNTREPALAGHEMTPAEPPLRLADRQQFVSFP